MRDHGGDRTGNVASYLLGAAGSDAVAVLHGSDSASHTQLANRSDAKATTLTASGIRRGDIVAMIGDNSIPWVTSYLAVLKCGAIALPLSGRESDRLLGRALSIDGVRCVISEEKYGERVRSLLCGTDAVQMWVDEGGADASEPPLTARFATVPVPPEHPAAIMMTSGSTGDPKGVLVSHRNIEVNTRAILSYLHLRSDDRMMVVLPFCYCFGLSLLHTHLRVGASLVLNNSFMFPQKVVAEMQQRACTGFAGVPSTFAGLLHRSRLAETSLPALRHVQQAGGRMPLAVGRQLSAALGPGVSLFVMYGATEATARMSYLPPACLAEKEGSIGVPVPGTRFEICDSEGKTAAVGEVGELTAIGDGIALGYFGDARLTRSRFQKLPCGARGFRTGDLARMDGDGFFYIEGRKADFIKSFGVRVSPREIEDVVIEHPEVADAAVFGLPDAESDEAIALCVVARSDTAHLPDAVREHCLRHLPNHKVPQHIRIVAALPRTESGKLKRGQLPRCFADTPVEA